jgi:hypothetical protein
VTACNANQQLIMFGGIRPDRSSYVVGEIVPGGTNTYAAGDGADVVENDATNGMNMPVEAMEIDFPLRLLRSELREGVVVQQRRVVRRPGRGGCSVEPVFEDRGDRGVGKCAELDRPVAGGLYPAGLQAAEQPKDSKGGAKALLGMRPAGP